MNKTIALILITLTVALALFACKGKPEAKKKNVVGQGIETPVMQMAEPPSQTAPAAASADKAAAPVPAGGSQTAQTGVEQGSQPVPPAQVTRSTQTVLKSQSNIEIVVDASGSMNGIIGKTTKIDAIKLALKNIFSTPLPPDIVNRKISLRVFGARSPSDKNDCSDTDLLLKMDKYDAAAITAALDKITPQGATPLAFVLEEANKDFDQPGETTDNVIILITDGTDSCRGDPVAAADRLSKGPSKVIINIIGFDVDQASQEALKKIAATASGQFALARSETELGNSLDQFINANLPYNLRVRVLSGGSPISSFITVYRAGTQQVIERSEASGIKFFKLQPGSYDVLVEYKGSIESTKPSRMIKGVEVTASSKAEQVVSFDLGNLSLTALDQSGTATKANFYIRKSGTEDIIGQLTQADSPQIVPLTPGTYDIDAETVEDGAATLTAQVKGVEVKVGETSDQTLTFQTGKLILKAQNVAKQNIPTSYKILKAGTTDVVATGEGPADGVTIELPPGKYSAEVAWNDPAIQGSPQATIEAFDVNGGETVEQTATIVTGTLKLSGKDTQKQYVHTEFQIRKDGSEGEPVKAISEGEPIEVFVEPGNYNIIATNTTSKIVPAPSVEWEDVIVKEGGTEAFEVVFKLGTIKLIGKNAKEQLLPATFYIYRAGTDEELVSETSEKDWVTFQLTPGLYDIKAEDTRAKSEPKPNIWFHDTEIKEGTSITKEAIFTSGKLKLICRGKNNVVLQCEFNVFTYGSDTALFSGATSDEWKEFDIPPGRYYMEAGWHDPVEEQFLKKWINVSIDENEIVEEVLRF